MNLKTLILSCLVFTSFTTVLCQNSIQGAWKRSELHVKSPDTSFVMTDLPAGLFMFTEKHYSMMYVIPRADRPDIKGIPDRDVTTEQAEAIFRSIVAQSGTYEVAGSNLTLRPVVAKRPDVMAGDVVNNLEYKIEKDALWILRTSSDGASMSQEKWVKVE